MYNKYRNANGEVAQLARASGSYPAGRRFESHLRYQIKELYYKSSTVFYIIEIKVSQLETNIFILKGKLVKHNSYII